MVSMCQLSYPRQATKSSTVLLLKKRQLDTSTDVSEHWARFFFILSSHSSSLTWQIHSKYLRSGYRGFWRASSFACVLWTVFRRRIRAWSWESYLMRGLLVGLLILALTSRLSGFVASPQSTKLKRRHMVYDHLIIHLKRECGKRLRYVSFEPCLQV